LQKEEEWAIQGRMGRESRHNAGDGEIHGTYCVWLPSMASQLLIKLAYIVELKFETKDEKPDVNAIIKSLSSQPPSQLSHE
jgi:hypothetical protein